jgi:hypothetical protein
MPMYYFNLRPDDAADKNLADSDGTDLPDPAAARHHANVVARELMYQRDDRSSNNWSNWTMSVTDAKGAELFSFAMRDY